MRVYLYSGIQRLNRNSSIGRAMYQLQFAAKENGVGMASGWNDADVVHINTIFLKSFILAYGARKRHIPVVYQVNFTEKRQNNTSLSRNLLEYFFEKWMKLCYNMGTIISVPTPYSKRCLESYGVNKEVEVVPNGVDILYYDKKNVDNTLFRLKYGYNTNELHRQAGTFAMNNKIIMSVGLVNEQNGVDDFIELARRMPEYQFIWFCETSLKTTGEKTNHFLQEKVPNLRFVGEVKQNELREAYGSCDLFLCPARQEVDGTAVLQALAMKIPILLRNIQVYTGWLQDDTEVYKADDVDSLEKKTKCILEGIYIPRVDAGHAVVEKRTIELIGEQVKEIYEKAIYLNEKEKGTK